jgi:hypothetical protein
MSVYQIERKPYQCQHRDAKPGECFVPECRNFGGLKETDPAAIFGKRSSSYLANRLFTSNPEEYRRLKQIAEDANLIPRTRVPKCLQPDPEQSFRS